MSFLRVFTTILHALEAAATISRPIVSAVDPEIGALMTVATNTAISVEASVTAAKSGTLKSDLVAQTTQSVLDLINGLRVSQGQPQLPQTIVTAATSVSKNVVDALNVVADAVNPSTPAPTPAS